MAHPYYEVLNVVKTGLLGDRQHRDAQRAGRSTTARAASTAPDRSSSRSGCPAATSRSTRWEDYPGSIVPYFTNKGTAYLDGIRWETILEAAQRAVRIENAEIDTLRNPLLQDVARLETNPDLSVSTFSEPSGYIISTNFERTDLDFHELAMRQAISHAIDRPGDRDRAAGRPGQPALRPDHPGRRLSTTRRSRSSTSSTWSRPSRWSPSWAGRRATTAS